MNCCTHQLHARVVVPLRTLTLVAVLPLALLPDITQAQVTTDITSDGNLGTQVTPNDNIHDITGGTRPGEGPNLFHSLGQFSVGAGDFANFLNETGAPTDNILSRVTGGNPSNIFGTIQTTGFPQANLFLMNPAGVLFGPTASLDVSGSFYATTADYLRLTDNVEFTAVPSPSDAALSIAPVVAFGFLNENPTGITFDGSSETRSNFNVPAENQLLLEVPEDQALFLIGGGIQVTGATESFDPFLSNPNVTGFRAPSGQINIASVASQGEVILDQSGPSTNFNVDSFAQLGEIEFTGGASIDVSDEPMSGSGSGGGTVIIRGGELTIDTSFVFADTHGDMNGAPVAIDIEIMGNATVDDALITADVFAGGDAGDISVTAGNLRLRDIPPVFFGIPIFPEARIGSRADPSAGTGSTGNVSLVAGDFRIEGRAEVTTSTGEGSGAGGDIAVSANNLFILGTPNPEDSSGILANTFGSDPGGRIQITANNVELASQGSIQSGNTDSGDAGGVALDLTGNLQLREGSFILGDSDGPGKAADININAQDINITGIRTATDPSDRSQGMFTGIDSSAESDGSGGDVNIMAENLRVTDNGTIKTSSTDIGSNAGGITIKVSDSIVLENSEVTTEAEQADGGDITLMAPNIIRLIDSELTTSVEGEPQTTGGNIDIDPEFVVLENSRIETTANQGDGGNINIEAGAFLADPASVLDVSSLSGRSGNVEINSPDTNIIEGTLELPESFLNVQSLLDTRCASRTTKPASSFFVTNGGLPLGPDTLIPAGVTGVGINSGESGGPQSNYSDEIPELLVQTSAFGGCTDEMM